jgi:hypothetical protein
VIRYPTLGRTHECPVYCAGELVAEGAECKVNSKERPRMPSGSRMQMLFWLVFATLVYCAQTTVAKLSAFPEPAPERLKNYLVNESASRDPELTAKPD